MNGIEFFAWLIGAAVVGWTIGMILADPRGILAPTWWGFVDVLARAGRAVQAVRARIVTRRTP